MALSSGSSEEEVRRDSICSGLQTSQQHHQTKIFPLPRLDDMLDTIKGVNIIMSTEIKYIQHADYLTLGQSFFYFLFNGKRRPDFFENPKTNKRGNIQFYFLNPRRTTIFGCCQIK